MNRLAFFLFSFFLLPSCSNFPEASIVYLDYAASFPVNEKAIEEFVRVSRLDGNSSGINPHAKRLQNIERQSALGIAEKIHADANQIHFTSGATIANNIAILGVAYKNPGCHLITSKIEHKSVLEVFKHLEKIGHTVTYLDVDRHGHIDVRQLEQKIRKNTKLISIQMFNSEIGTLHDVYAIGKIARQHGVLFHSDAAQSFCKYDIDVKDMNIDLLTIAGHKIGAQQGIAAIYIRDPEEVSPILYGSGDKFFPGTKPTALISAFSSAAKSYSFDREKVTSNYKALRQKLLTIENVYINSGSPSHVLSVSIGGVLLRDILDRMRKYSFSAGCSCLGQERSNVINAIDPDDKLPTCTIRISFSDKTSRLQLMDFAEKLKIVVEQLRREKSISKGCDNATSSIFMETNENYGIAQLI
jgi:cysteine desulfurase